MLLVAGLVVGAAGWYLSSRPASPPPADSSATTAASPEPTDTKSDASTLANDAASSTERPDRPADRGGNAARPATSRAEATRPAPAPAVAPRELRVSSDVEGAYVFLDRKFLGTTPLVSRDVAPGTYQLNVQVEGRPPVVRTIDIAAEGPTEVSVPLPPAAQAAAAQLSASVAVVHQHAMGSCEGTLRASGEGLRYDTPHKDAFTLPFRAVETFTVDYTEKRLRLKQRGGRTWNFTTRAATADPLFVFHRDVEAARQ